jgi:ubiquinone/menaquinone biosynthesis C-methylase UbiE
MLSSEETLAKTASVFNAAADNFDEPALSFWHRFGQKTVDYLELRAGDCVLDVCCGTGASAIPAAVAVGPSGQVLGVDLADSLLQLARHKAEKQGLENIEFIKGDFLDLALLPENLPENSPENFDAIVCVFGIFFVPDMTAAIQSLWKRLRPSGKLAITSWAAQAFEPASQAFWTAIEAERPDLVRCYSPWDRINDADSLKALLESGGATQVSVTPQTIVHELASPEDWWTIVLGGGLRGTVDQLEASAQERVKQANLAFIRDRNIRGLDLNVLYAIAQKAPRSEVGVAS